MVDGWFVFLVVGVGCVVYLGIFVVVGEDEWVGVDWFVVEFVVFVFGD